MAAPGAAGAAKTAGMSHLDKLKAKDKNLLTKPSKTGGQDLVRKPIKQRVRRNCHKCDHLFMPGDKTCPGCEHIRCKKCPRDP